MPTITESRKIREIDSLSITSFLYRLSGAIVCTCLIQSDVRSFQLPKAFLLSANNA